MSARPRTWGEYFADCKVASRELAEAQRVFNDAGKRLDECSDLSRKLEAWALTAEKITPFSGSNYDEPCEASA